MHTNEIQGTKLDFDLLTSAWEHIWKVEDALVPMMTDTFVFLVRFGLHSQPGRSRHRPAKKETESQDQ